MVVSMGMVVSDHKLTSWKSCIYNSEILAQFMGGQSGLYEKRNFSHSVLWQFLATSCETIEFAKVVSLFHSVSQIHYISCSQGQVFVSCSKRRSALVSPNSGHIAAACTELTREGVGSRGKGWKNMAPFIGIKLLLCSRLS